MAEKFLVIQTAFPGDVILATALIESLHQAKPEAQIHMLVRLGNEFLLANHPFIQKILILDKKKNKVGNLIRMAGSIRKEHYTMVINIQRFASSGILTALSGSPQRIGFDKNPFSLFFTQRIKHKIGDGRHETQRNQELIAAITDKVVRPKLYPSTADFAKVKAYQDAQYICIAPGSVWFTKTFPAEKWIAFARQYLQTNQGHKIYLIGSAGENNLCMKLILEIASDRVVNLAGQLTFLESAALMAGASMNYVNDSAPLHLASSMNAPVTVVYCSTIPAFGFGPLSDRSRILETTIKLDCRPCGLHGFQACPKGHFLCAKSIEINQLLPAHD